MAGNHGSPDHFAEVGFHHDPVMLQEIVDLTVSLPAGLFLDATVGGAGHAASVLEANPALQLYGVDRDPLALHAAQLRLRPFADRFRLERARFDRFDNALDYGKSDGFVGFLFDLGISSPQVDTAERGFSFRHDGPLDMRMNPEDSLTAEQIVNTYSSRELAAILRANADERYSHRIAGAIVAARPITGTVRLAEVVASAIPAPARRSGGHPARRTFQALRIEVNDELRILRPALDRALDALQPGGRGIVLTYHSGEDRITKDAFRQRVRVDVPKDLPIQEPEPEFSLLRPIARKPSAAEVDHNPRASSARLRAIERRAA